MFISYHNNWKSLFLPVKEQTVSCCSELNKEVCYVEQHC
jgi:hypothetical protein